MPLVSRAARRDQAAQLHGSEDAWLPSLSRMVVKYTDASFSHGSGGLGVMVFDFQSGSASWCSLRVPAWLCARLEDRKTQIHHFEMLSTLCAVVTFGDLLRNRRVLFFCDSTTAMSAAVHAHRAHCRYVYG